MRKLFPLLFCIPTMCWQSGRRIRGNGLLISPKRKRLDQNENVLLLDAGDTFQGSSAAGLYRGEGIVRIMNSMNYDAMVAGDHDFDYGWQRLWEFAEVTDFPVLSANVFGSDGIELLLPLTIKELNGISIGIFGLTTPETLYKTNPLNVEGLTIIDPIEKARNGGNTS